jgi:multicomponent Na+:H+ antiporter subunit G
VSAHGVAAIVLASIGLVFSLSGAVGILRMPDLYTRVQCSSKNVTMGALPLLVAVVVFVLNPVASHALTRAAYKVGVEMWPGSVVDAPAERDGRA